MRYQARKLISVLREQFETVSLTDAAGNTRIGISSRVAADLVEQNPDAWIGHGRGCVERVLSVDLKAEPFATAQALAQAMASYPRSPRAQKNVQQHGAPHWTPQPTHSRTGRFGSLRTIHFSPKQ